MASTLVESPSARLRRAGTALHRLTPPAVLAAIAAGAAAVLLLWLHDTPPTLHTPGDYLTASGRITGLLAGYAVVVLVLLMARLPLLERRVGADRLARWHAFGARYTVSLIVAHALLITWGYALAAHASPVAEAGTLLASYPDVLMATVGTGLLLVVGIVSARAARRRLRYETWYYLHLYTYLAIALAFAHQFATGADFVSNQPARVLWATLYLGAAVLLVWYRIVVPARSAARHRMTVHDVQRSGRGVVSVVITGSRLGELHAQPGQFFRWRFLTRDGWWQSHPYSLSAPAHGDFLRITIKSLGDHTRALRLLRPGTKVIAEGPYGAFTADLRSRRRVLLIAGGIGITPIRALFESMQSEPGAVDLLYRANRREELVFADELTALGKRRRARVRFLLGPPGGVDDPLASRQLTELVPDVRSREVFLCGPPGMVAAATAALAELGVARRHIHHESFEL
ncbi:MAG: ferric reductase [Pseudonocardiales bacterium]|nr:MAG: ferric reductase [Pseudonocardiales bacterium]